MAAKIFRINYKSDFVLTLNSDAGWMTPFCIKFWTGAPSQAFFVGWDGETYTHCAPVAGEPTKLLVQFDDHHLPIGDLKFQIAYHFTVADFPNDTEDEVINPSNITTEIDGETYQVMLDFTGETAPEIEFSLPAYANEAQRIENEQQRIAAETQRIANEETRISNEQTRVAQEQTRQQNEAQRIAQESARVSEFASLKSASEAATRDANNAATLANEKAQLADDKAALADRAATQASINAVYAHDEGQLAGQKAIEAAQATQLATNEAAFAHDQGTYAKNQGDYAKAQGDTALADHVRANADHSTAVDDHTKASNDHTRAESDHSTSAADHTTAGNDHTLAESDHGIAADDHTQAGNDHTRAESDHGIASDDHTQAGNDHTRAESDHTRAESDHAAVEVYVDSLGAFDISAYHATGGVLAEYADLTAALGTNGANIPDALRKGGMSIKFIQGTVQNSDNKYVQFRCMAQNFTTDITKWQGVDDEPTAGSDNLVKSGGVARRGFLTSLKEIQTLYSNNILPLTKIKANGNATRAGFTSIKILKGEFLRLDLSVADNYDVVIQMTDNDMALTTNPQNEHWINGWYTNWTGPRHIMGFYTIPESYTAQDYAFIQIWFRKHDNSQISIQDLLNYAIDDVFISLGVESPTASNSNSLGLFDTTEVSEQENNLKLSLKYNAGTETNPDNINVDDITIGKATSQKAGLMSAEDYSQLKYINKCIKYYNADIVKIEMTDGAVNGKYGINSIITTGLAINAVSGYECAVLQCREGECYTISSTSVNQNYPAFFIASHFPAVDNTSEYYKMRSVICNVSNEYGLTRNLPIEIPPLEDGSDSQYLVINSRKANDDVSFKGLIACVKNNRLINNNLYRGTLNSSDLSYYRASANVNPNPYWFNSITRLSTELIRVHPYDVIRKVDSLTNVKFNIYKFDKNFSLKSATNWITDSSYSLENLDGYAFILLAFVDDSVIDDSNIGVLRNAISVVGKHSEGLNVKTINGESIEGEGNIQIETQVGTGILDLNPDFEFVNKLRQMKRQPRIGGKPQPEGAPITPLVLAHFSDIHIQTSNLSRIIEFCNHHSTFIDDIVCSGDMVSFFTDGMDWWKSVSGSENILTCIGNHEPRVGEDWGAKTMAECYEEFMYGIANWGVQYQANKTYYYKDYSNAKVRLIVIDCIRWDTDQSDWFSSLLVNAQLNGLSVVVVSHYKPTLLDGFDCPFNNIQQFNDTAFRAQLASIVDLFMNGTLTAIVGGETTSMTSNGEFVCYLSGHTHIDQIGVLQNYQNQLNITIDCAAANHQSGYSDIARVENSKSFDLFNLVAVDTYQKLVKIARVGANIDSWLREKDIITVQYASSLAKTVSKPTIIT